MGGAPVLFGEMEDVCAAELLKSIENNVLQLLINKLLVSVIDW